MYEKKEAKKQHSSSNPNPAHFAGFFYENNVRHPNVLNLESFLIIKNGYMVETIYPHICPKFGKKLFAP
jgi:hypothetical protein